MEQNEEVPDKDRKKKQTDKCRIIKQKSKYV